MRPGMRGSDSTTTASTLGRAAGVTVMSLLLGSIAATPVAKAESKRGHHAKVQGPLLVTATAYNSLVGQTEDDPEIAAWGDRLQPGMLAIAVSNDLETLGMKRGTKVRIEGLTGEFLVLDRMPPRWQRRIDIYMGVDVHAAKHWGRRDVRIYWQTP
jgi:3D (Asp-Asp-Asp) domain-containing protein